ncbi:RHS repeat domain-containing protein [Actinopolyspora mzabensis]|nr:RHS repeat domain-containing protein [Actinopolyspora mzabensis]
MTVPVAAHATDTANVSTEQTGTTGLSLPDSVWTPSEKVDRTPNGGPAPAESWDPPGNAARQAPSRAAVETAAEAVTCEPGQATGILPQYPLERFQISDRVELAVNTFNGNLVATSRDLTIRGTGQNLSLNHVYNSQLPGAGSYGQGRSINAGGDIGLTFDGSDVVLHGASGYCATFTADGSGGYTPAPGVDAELDQLADGSYELSWNGSGEVWAFSAEGWLNSRTSRNGNTTTYHYTDNGNLSSITDSQDRVTNFEHDGAGRITRITDPTGTTAGTYTYNDAGQMTTFTERGGNRYLFNYTEAGNLLRLTLPDYSQYQFRYNAADQLTQVRAPNGSTRAITRFAYGDHETTVTDPNGHESVYTYDQQGRRITAVDPLGHQQSSTWTASSDVATTTDGLDNSTTAEYDRLNNLIGTKLPTGANTSVGYTSSAHPHLPTTVTDAQGNTTTRSYDQAGNLTEVRSQQLDTTLRSYTYNPDGTVATDTNGNGATTGYAYDDAGNLITITPPGPLGETSYTYDALSRVTSVTDGNGTTIEYSYDKLDRIVAISHDGTVLQTMSYDGVGNLANRETATASTEYRYRRAGQIIWAERDAGGDKETVRYDYDPTGNLTELVDPNGTTTYGYDAANRTVSMTDPAGQTTEFGYDAADRRTRTTFPGAGTRTSSYDAAGRQTGITVSNTAGDELFTADYSYTTPRGSDSTLLQSRTIDGHGDTYTYDPLNRITSSGSGNGSYSYDTASNITSDPSGTDYSSNAADQLTQQGDTSYSYDDAGNLTSSTYPGSSRNYSPTDQLTSAQLPTGSIDNTSYDTVNQTQPRSITETTDGRTVTHTFTHTALGITSITDNGQRTGYHRDPNGTLITEVGPDGTRQNAITDQRGTILALLGNDGTITGSYDYDTYGETTATGQAAKQNPFRYTGAYQLDTGDYLLGHRTYDTTTKRFTQPDPSRQENNRYAYAKCNPTNNTDPTGLSAASTASTIASAALGCVTGAIAAYQQFGTAATLLALSTAGTGATVATVGIAAFGCLSGGFTSVYSGVTVP